MRHNRLLMILVAGLLMSSCTTLRDGSFTPVPAPVSQAMVQDTLMQLVTTYPPAHTTIQFAHPSQDSYGVNLQQALRTKGYGVSVATGMASRSSSVKPITLRYIIDAPLTNTRYRLTVIVDHHVMTRAYQHQGQQGLPLGVWTRQDEHHGY